MGAKLLDKILSAFGRGRGPGGTAQQVKACKLTWQYQHSPEALARAQEADSRDFLHWILSCPELDPEAISRRELISLYAEFCDVNDLRPMPWGRFDRSLRGAGFVRARSSGAGRPWLYRAVRPGSASVYKLPPAVAAPRERVAA